jgi:hypothetical protein
MTVAAIRKPERLGLMEILVATDVVPSQAVAAVFVHARR